MPGKKVDISEEYDQESSSTSAKALHDRHQGVTTTPTEPPPVEEIRIDSDRYGTGKPTREVIRATITHDVG